MYNTGVRSLITQYLYCTISINSAGHVMCHMPAEILILAHGGNDCYTKRKEKVPNQHYTVFWRHYNKDMVDMCVWIVPY